MTSLSKVSFFSPLLLLAAEAAEHRVDAGQHLLHLKGLDDIVVGAPSSPATLSWVSPWR